MKNSMFGQEMIKSSRKISNKYNEMISTTGSTVIDGSTYTYTIEPYGDKANTVFSGWKDQKYRVSITTPAGMETLDLGFSSTLNQSITDESWGIDNLSYTKPPVGGGDSIYSRRFNSLPTDIENAKVEVESSSEWGAFLGRFGNEKTSIHIPLNIGSHLTTSETTGDDLTGQTIEGGRAQTIEFDFLRIDSWDGEFFQVYSGDDIILQERFYFGRTNEVTHGIQLHLMDLTYHYTIEPNGKRSNTVFSGWDDQKYRITITTPPELATIDLGFSSTLNQSIADESWGIDNLVTPVTNLELELLNEENLLDIRGYIELSDTIHEIEPSVTLNITPLATPVEVFTVGESSESTNDNLQFTLNTTEGSLFTDGLIAAFGDVNLGGNVSDLYTSGPEGGGISLDPVFEELGSTSTLPEQLVVPIHQIGFDLLDENPILESYVEVITLNAFDTLSPVVPSNPKADYLSAVKRDFDLRELLGGEPQIGETYQVDINARLGTKESPIGLRMMIIDENETRILNRLQDVELDMMRHGDLSTEDEPFEITDRDILSFPWTRELSDANAILRIMPELELDKNVDIDNIKIKESLVGSVQIPAYADIHIKSGRVNIPLLNEGSATWADVDNDGDQDLLLSGVSRETGMLTTRLLNNPLIGGGDNFSDIAISLPGLKRGSTSWADYDNDGDLDLAITGAQGSEELPYLQIFRNTTSERIQDAEAGEPEFEGMVNRQPDVPKAEDVGWNSEHNAIQFNWNFSHLTNDDAPYTYNLAVGTEPGIFDVQSPLADPESGKRRIASPGNQGFHNAGLLNSAIAGERYYWSVQAIDAGMRGSSWGEGEAFTVQPLVPEYQGSQTEHSETNIQETLYLCVTPQPGRHTASVMGHSPSLLILMPSETA